MSISKKRFLILLCALLAAMLTAFFVTAFGFRARAAEVTGHREIAGFDSDSFEIVKNRADGGESDRVPTDGIFTFKQVQTEKSTALAFRQKLTGEYSVEFYHDAWLSQRTHLFLTLGANSDTLGASGGIVFEFNSVGITNVQSGVYAVNASQIGWNDKAYVRFTVKADGNVDIYFSKTPLTDADQPVVTQPFANADFSLTDGYVLFSNGEAHEEMKQNYNVDAMDIGLDDLKIKCEAQEIDFADDFDFLNPLDAAWKVSGDTSKAIVEYADRTARTSARAEQTKFHTVDDQKYVSTEPVVVDIPLMKSKFEITDEGVADGEQVFEMSFRVSRTFARGTPWDSLFHWGLAFGVEGDTILPEDPKVGFQYNNFYVGTQNNNVCVFLSDGHELSVTVTGYKGGRLVARYKCPYSECAQENGEHVIETTAENPVSFNGKFAFGTFNESKPGALFDVWDLKFSGNVKESAEVKLVAIDETALENFCKGDSVELSAAVEVTPRSAVYAGVDWSILSGAESVALDGSTLRALNAGEVTLKAVSKLDATKFDEVTFRVLDPQDVFAFAAEKSLARIQLGGSLPLNISYTTIPDVGFGAEVTYSLTEGAESVVTIEGETLNAVGTGRFVLRATAENGQYREYAGRVYDKTYAYDLKGETFAGGIDTQVWGKVLPGAGEIVNRESGFFNRNGIVFLRTASANGLDPKLVLKGMPFGRVNGSDMVFDITFTAAVGPRSMSQEFGVGLLFGMPDERANLTTPGVGGVRVTTTEVAVSLGGQRLTPTYVTSGDEYSYGRETSAAFTSNAPITLRLVGKTDGKLYLYRGQSYEEKDNEPFFTINTDITKLYATYEGFDFSGYTAFFSSGDGADFAGIIENVSVKGTVLYDEAEIVKSIRVDTELDGIRYAPGIADIELAATVNLEPNLPGEGGWTVTVTEGADVAEIVNGKFLRLKGKGDVTLRFVSKTNPAVTAEKSFTVLAPEGKIDFDAGCLGGLVVGDTVSLSAKYVTEPPTEWDASVSYTLTAGDNVVSLADGKLTALNPGSAILRITSVYDSEVFAEFEFEIADLERYKYQLTEKFDELTEETWYVKQHETGTVIADGGLAFVGAHNDADGVNPKAVLQIPFYRNPQTGIVFDVTFTAQPGSRQDLPFGFMFAMPGKDSNVGDAGVGSIRFTKTWAHVYRAGEKLTPNYVTQAQPNTNEWYGKDDGFAFMSDNPMTVRLVGRNDGTLELYLDMHYGDYGVSLDKLFATYDGFDFEGYVGFFADAAPDFGSYTAAIRNLYLEGTYLYDPADVEVRGISLDESNLVDLFYMPAPLELGIKVRAVPNLELFTGYSVEVVSGPATVSGNLLTLTGAGEVKLKIVSAFDKSVFIEKTLTVSELNIEKITIDTSVFENVTTDSQPIPLSATVQANTYLPRYLTVTFSVVSGNAEIAGGQLRITGPGTVVIQAVSDAKPDKFATFEFVVKDNDAQYDTNGAFDENGEEKGGCKSPSYELIGCLSLLLAGAAAFRKIS